MKLTTINLPGGQVLVWAPVADEWWDYQTGLRVHRGVLPRPTELAEAHARRTFSMVAHAGIMSTELRTHAVLAEGLNRPYCPICQESTRMRPERHRDVHVCHCCGHEITGLEWYSRG